MQLDADALTELIVQTVKAAVLAEHAKITADVTARLTVLEGQKALVPRDGRNGEPGPVGPPGPPGERGLDGAPGAKGDPGPEGPAGVAGQKGLDGLHGRDGAAGEAGPQGPPGERGLQGEKGLDGRDGLHGRDGMPGLQGEKGLDGKDGEDGRPGTDGRDGVLENLKFVFDGERTVTACFKNGDPVEGGVWKFPVSIYQGVYVAGKSYERGDSVTFGGSQWNAMADTNQKPGDGATAWRLAVKVGRDGKAGPQGPSGPAGIRGEKGDPGGRY